MLVTNKQTILAQKCIKEEVKFAFTLAEVLITLGIIGVVAALTIPGLINNSREQEYTNALKVFHSEISQAMSTMQAPDSEFTVPENYASASQESSDMRDNLCSIMSCIKQDTVTKVFGASIYQNDVGNTIYKNYKSSSPVYTDLPASYSAAVLKNGMLIGVGWNMEARNGFQFFVDTNGRKGPNMFGQDLNMFEIVKDANGYYKPVIEGGKGSWAQSSGWTTCVKNSSGYSDEWACSYFRLYAPDQLP